MDRMQALFASVSENGATDAARIQARLIESGITADEFSCDRQTVYDQVAGDHSGANADDIPILRDAEPGTWGVGICTVDGQRMAIGDVDIHHSIQSVSKPIT